MYTTNEPLGRDKLRIRAVLKALPAVNAGLREARQPAIDRRIYFAALRLNQNLRFVTWAVGPGYYIPRRSALFSNLIRAGESKPLSRRERRGLRGIRRRSKLGLTTLLNLTATHSVDLYASQA